MRLLRWRIWAFLLPFSAGRWVLCREERIIDKITFKQEEKGGERFTYRLATWLVVPWLVNEAWALCSLMTNQLCLSVRSKLLGTVEENVMLLLMKCVITNLEQRELGWEGGSFGLQGLDFPLELHYITSLSLFWTSSRLSVSHYPAPEWTIQD